MVSESFLEESSQFLILFELADKFSRMYKIYIPIADFRKYAISHIMNGKGA